MRVLGLVAGTTLGLLVTACSSSDGSEPSAGGAGGQEDNSVAGSPAESGAGGLDAHPSGGSNGDVGGWHSGGASAGTSNSAGSSGASGSGGSSANHHFSIKFDYRFDTVNFFTTDRRAALEAAGALWSNIIHDDFPALPKGTGIRLKNPENRDEDVWVHSIEADVDGLIVFVGTSEAIPGLGRGGPSGTTQTDDQTLAAALAARRDGAVFEPWAGSISFKASSNFFFDQTPATADDIPLYASDFITTAAHELGHVLGFSSGCTAFLNFTADTTFIGPTAQAVYGAPVPLATDLGHFLDHVQSDGAETLMDPGIPSGTRINPTRLDRAVFTDIGYEISD